MQLQILWGCHHDIERHTQPADLRITSLRGFAPVCPLRHYHEYIQVAIRSHSPPAAEPNRMMRKRAHRCYDSLNSIGQQLEGQVALQVSLCSAPNSCISVFLKAGSRISSPRITIGCLDACYHISQR